MSESRTDEKFGYMYSFRTDVLYLVQVCKEVAYLRCSGATVINCVPIAIFDSCLNLVHELNKVARKLNLNVPEDYISIDNVCNDAFAMRIDEYAFIDIRRIYRNCIKAELLR